MGGSHMAVNRSIWDQGRSQDFVQGVSKPLGGPRYPLPKTEDSSDLALSPHLRTEGHKSGMRGPLLGLVGSFHVWEGPNQPWRSTKGMRRSIFGKEGAFQGLRGPISGLRGLSQNWEGPLHAWPISYLGEPTPDLRGPTAGLRVFKVLKGPILVLRAVLTQIYDITYARVAVCSEPLSPWWGGAPRPPI